MAQDEQRAAVDPDLRARALEVAEAAIEGAHETGRADRAAITQEAQGAAREAVDLVGVAMEADELADDATRLAIVAERMGADRSEVRAARKRERAARKKAKEEHKAATKAAKQAYDAVKFSQPNKMGFMRAVQVVFAFHIVLYLILLMVTSRDNMTYDVTTAMDWVMAILEGVAFWMFINRYKIARPFVMGMAGLGLAASAATDLATGEFHLLPWLLSGWFYVFLLLYFGLSKRVRATLVNDVSQYAGTYDKASFTIKRSGWPFVRNLGIYFVIFSILGHWMEMAMCQLIIAGLVEGEYDPTNTMLWRDWLYPFPMEGMAVVLIAVALYPLWQWLIKKMKNRVLPYVISFVANALTCSLIEFSMGLIYNAHYELWDYRENFGNIMGQVCLQNALAFGAAASIIAWFVYPMLERWLARVPQDVMNMVFVAVMVFGGIVFALYIVTPPEIEAPTPSEEESLQEDVDALTVQLWMLDGSLDEMQEMIDKCDMVDQQPLTDALSRMREEESGLAEALGLDHVPTDEEIFG